MTILLNLQVGGATPVVRGFDHYWAVILKIGKNATTFTAQDVIDLSDISEKSQVRDFIRRLEAAEYIESTGIEQRGRARLNVYVLRKPQDETPRLNRSGRRGLQGDGQQNMWNVIRKGRLFHARELAVQASTDEVKVEHETAKRYVRELESAGYLSVRDPGAGRKPRIYMLKPGHNTGPRPPAILRAKVVWDRNKGEIMGRVLAEEEPS